MTNQLIQNSEFSTQNSPWWVQRWIELLDSYRFKKRLERARIYAREGNVLSIDFQGEEVLAKVQGTEIEPYQVSLSLLPFSDEDWDYVIETLSQKAIFSAQLLAGEMPANIEEVFTKSGLSLFPFNLSDIRSRCSCPDKVNPCKHIGAVYYQLADRFSENPFILFQLRGRTKTQILDALRQKRQQAIDINLVNNLSNTITEKATKKTQKKHEQDSSQPSKLQSSLYLAQFWQYNEPLESSLVVIIPPTDGKTVLDLLGTIPLAYEEAEAVQQYLQQVYKTVSQQAMMTALGRED